MSSILSQCQAGFQQPKIQQGQLTHQSRFQEAAAYARRAAKTNPIYAELAKGTMKTAYNSALSDWFNPPVIRQIKRKNGRILIEANNNVLVSKVLVTILDVDEKIVERGEAEFVKDTKWEYVSVTDAELEQRLGIWREM